MSDYILCLTSQINCLTKKNNTICWCWVCWKGLWNCVQFFCLEQFEHTVLKVQLLSKKAWVQIHMWNKSKNHYKDFLDKIWAFRIVCWVFDLIWNHRIPHWGKNTHFIQKFAVSKSHFFYRNSHFFYIIHIYSNIKFKWIYGQKVWFCPSVNTAINRVTKISFALYNFWWWCILLQG